MDTVEFKKIAKRAREAVKESQNGRRPKAIAIYRNTHVTIIDARVRGGKLQGKLLALGGLWRDVEKIFV